MLNDLQKKKIKIGFDLDTKALNSLKKTLEGFKNIKIGVNADTKNATSSVKSVSNNIKQTNDELNKQKQIYSQLKSLQNEEYAIKKKMVGASGEYKAVLQQQLNSVQQQQTAARNLLTEGSKNLANKEKELQLSDQMMKKERELVQARSKANSDMERAIENAKKNIDKKVDNGLFNTKQAEEYKKRLDEIDKTNMNHVRSEISRIGQEMDVQRNKTKDFANDLGRIGDSLSSAGDALIAIFALPTAGLVASVKTMSDFSFEMSKVEAISGASGQALAALENKAKELGRETMWSAKESAEALKYMGMAGWDSTAMLEGLPHMLNLASAGGLALGTASDIVTDALTAFKLEASSTAEFVDVLAVASSKSNTNVQMMGESFKMSASIAGALNYSIQDVALSLGLMANSGIKSGMAGRALRQMMSGLNGGVELVTKSTKAWRVESANADGSMRPLKDLLGDLREAFADMSDAQKASNAEAIAGKTGMAGLLAIVTASQEEYNKLADAIENADGAADKMREIMEDNLKGDFEKMLSASKDVAIGFGKAMEPSLRSLTQHFTKVINNFSQMSDSSKKTLIAITALGSGFNGSKKMIRKILELKDGISSLALKLGTTPKLLLGVTGGFIALGAALYTVFTHEERANRKLQEFNKTLAENQKASTENIKQHTSDIEQAKATMTEIEALEAQLGKTKNKDERIQLEKEILSKKQALIDLMPDVAEGMDAEASS